MNATDQSIKYNLIVAQEKTVVTIPAKAIQTLIY